MTDLEDAIDLLTDDKYRPPEITNARFLVLKAARRVANPDLEAVSRLIREHWEDTDVGPAYPFTPEEMRMSEQLAREFVNAALSITTEDTDGD